MSRPQNYDLSASFVFLLAAMRLDDLVGVESHANLDVPCASWGLTNQFLKGRPQEELPILCLSWSS